MTIEHHRDLAHEFPDLKQRIHELKLASAEFRRLYREYQTVDKEIHRIEQDIETPSDAFTETLKFRRVWLKDYLHGLLTGRIASASDLEGQLARGRYTPPVRESQVARDWSARGYSHHAEVDPAGEERHDVVHGRDSVVTVLEGRLEIALAGACWTLEPGDELSIPHGAVHTIRNTHDGRTRWLFGCARGG
jgi:uncharacterized protein YdcH (DUF465 family)